MSEYVVVFRDGNSVIVEARNPSAAIQVAEQQYPSKRVASVQRTRPMN